MFNKQNQIQRYNAQQEFAVEKVYRKLTHGIDDLPPGEAVDALLGGANCLRQGIAQVLEKIFQGAESRQNVVMQQVTNFWKGETESLQKAIAQASATGNYDEVEKCLREATKANLSAKESVSKMKYIRQRGQTEYNPVKELTQFARELEDFAKRRYSNTQRMIEG